MSKKIKDKDFFNEKPKKSKKKKCAYAPGIRMLLYTHVNSELATSVYTHESILKLKIQYFTKTGRIKNLPYDDKTKIRFTMHQKFVLYTVENGEPKAITSNVMSKDSEDFVCYELNFVDFLSDMYAQIAWNLPLIKGADREASDKPMRFYVIDSTSKAKEPQKYSILDRAQSIATIIKVKDGKEKDFCQMSF